MIAYRSAYMSQSNRSVFDVTTTGKVLCHGPKGFTAQAKDAMVEVGCPGPPEKWNWNTGTTTVKDSTSSATAVWEVDYDKGSADAKKVHAWTPGFEVDGRKHQGFTILLRSTVRWIDTNGRIQERPYEWPYPLTFMP
jgi:hypothetical protein